jgi:hypothetical protein
MRTDANKWNVPSIFKEEPKPLKRPFTIITKAIRKQPGRPYADGKIRIGMGFKKLPGNAPGSTHKL